MSQQEESNVECIDFESRMLLQFCRFHQLLIGTYASVNKLVSSPDETANASQTDNNEVSIKKTCFLSVAVWVNVHQTTELMLCKNQRSVMNP